jgi:hypothetical protein
MHPHRERILLGEKTMDDRTKDKGADQGIDEGETEQSGRNGSAIADHRSSLNRARVMLPCSRLRGDSETLQAAGDEEAFSSK